MDDRMGEGMTIEGKTITIATVGTFLIVAMVFILGYFGLQENVKFEQKCLEKEGMVVRARDGLFCMKREMILEIQK